MWRVARPMSHWLRRSRYAAEVARDGAEAVRAALSAPGQIATLVLPADTAWDEARGPAEPLPIPDRSVPQPEAIEAARAALASGEPCVLLMNGQALRPALAQAARVAEASGARLFHDTFVSRLTRGPGLPTPERLPYFGEQALEALEGTAHLILVGTRPPVSFFLPTRTSPAPLCPRAAPCIAWWVSKGMRWPPLRRWLMPLTRRPRRA